jgi:hypothetical protein
VLMPMLTYLDHPLRKLQLFFAFVALGLCIWGWTSSAGSMLGDYELLLIPVSQLFLCISLGLGTIGPSVDGHPGVPSTFSRSVMRGLVIVLAVSNAYVVAIDLKKVAQARHDRGLEPPPLVQAIQRNDVARVKALVESGASLSSRDMLDLSPLDYAAGALPGPPDQPSGSLGAVEILIAQGVDINGAGRYERTPLMYAVRSHNPELIRFLIGHGADVNRVSRDGHSALFYAQLDGNEQVVKLLEEAGATSTGPGESRSSSAPNLLLEPEWTACASEGDCAIGIVGCWQWVAVNQRFILGGPSGMFGGRYLTVGPRPACAQSIDPGPRPAKALCVTGVCRLRP